MKKCGFILLLGCLGVMARAQPPVPLAEFAAGRMQVDARLIDSLAGVDDRALQERVQQTIRRSGRAAAESGGKGAWNRGYIEVKVDGGRVALRSCRYTVSIVLKRYEPDAEGVGQLKAVDTKTVTGSVAAASLSMAVLLAVEEQTEALLAQATSTAG